MIYGSFMDVAPPGRGPLDGIRVVALEQAVAAPFATRQLGDLGAEIVKVERPDGGDFARRYDDAVHGTSSYFFWLNRGKKSVVLDIKSEEGRAELDQLIATADVFVQNLSPAAAERAGLTAALLQPHFPGLIVCQLRGYGGGGPCADRKAYDLLIQCETGLAVATGGEAAPVKVGVSIADISAGMYAFSAILAALYDRARGNAARSIEISLFDSLSEWMSVPAYLTAGTGRETPVYGLAHPTIAPYGPQPTTDGTVVVAVQNEREWRRLCIDVLAEPALADDPRFAGNTLRVAHRDALDARIAATTQRHDSGELVRLLDRAGIANARVRTVREFLDHPELSARGRLVPVHTPDGDALAMRPPITMSGLNSAMGPVPSLGEHTAEILATLTGARGRLRNDARLPPQDTPY